MVGVGRTVLVRRGVVALPGATVLSVWVVGLLIPGGWVCMWAGSCCVRPFSEKVHAGFYQRAPHAARIL